MEHSQISFVPLLIVVGIAFVVPILLSRLRGIFIPIIIGEILAGIIVGKSGLDLVPKNAVLEILSTLGFIYLMFLSGLEINFSDLLESSPGGSKSRWRHIVSSHLFLATAAYLLAVFLSVLVSFILARFDLVKSPWMMALILSTTSLGVVIPVLKQEGFTREPFGQLIIACSLVPILPVSS